LVYQQANVSTNSSNLYFNHYLGTTITSVERQRAKLFRSDLIGLSIV